MKAKAYYNKLTMNQNNNINNHKNTSSAQPEGDRFATKQFIPPKREDIPQNRTTPAGTVPRRTVQNRTAPPSNNTAGTPANGTAARAHTVGTASRAVTGQRENPTFSGAANTAQRGGAQYGGQRRRTAADEKSKTTLVILLAIISALIVTAIGMGIFFVLYKPSVDVERNPDNIDNPAIVGLDDINEFTPPETSDDGSSSETVKRKKETYNFLVIGRDKVGLNTDVIMLINFNTGSGEISVMQIPRDTYIEIGGSSCKINSVYSIMHSRAALNGVSDSEDRGMTDMAAVLEANLGIEIDYYALLNLTGFGNIIDTIGGIPMNVPYDMDYDDPFQDLHIHIKAGQQTLNGEKAQQFIRFRDGYIAGDIGRIDAQKLFMTACIEQLKNNLNASTIIGLVNELYTNLKTSLSIADVGYFIKQFFLTEDNNISFITFPGEDTYAGGVSYYVMKRADMLALVNRYFNVYSKDISEAEFDPYLIFNRENSADVSSIYEKKGLSDISAYVKSAGSIDDNGLRIDLK